MKTICCLFLVVFGLRTSFGQVYAKSNYSPTYNEIIAFYTQLDKKHKEATLKSIGETDIGKPLHVFSIVNPKSKLPETQKIRILINNGIHAGEPDGINASMQLADEILNHWSNYAKLFDSVELHIVAIYNVDGCLRRGKNQRANQNGPEEHGFRGNYQNLDLNRDFIKMDSKNAFGFVKIFQKINPHILVDTHVSNGADYQYTFTYFFSQPDKLPDAMAKLSRNMETQFTQNMQQLGTEVIPYVNHHDDTPLSGITAFYDSPRYCTGYASLFNCIAITTETHMLKPFNARVKATYNALWAILKTATKNQTSLVACKQNPIYFYNNPNTLNINYVNDTSTYENILFKGYKAYVETSKVTGLPQLYYDENTPVTNTIKYYNKYISNTSIQIPAYYIIPQSWHTVIARLKANKVPMQRLKNDTTLTVYYQSLNDKNIDGQFYEGHYYHKNVKTTTAKKQKHFFTGDYIIATGNLYTRFLVEVLEPEAVDSYFRWNFFDACLQQKEWFSDYVFDKKAEELLEKDADLKKRFEVKKREDPEWAKSSFNQLYFIYQNSLFYEQTAFEIPVYKIFKDF